MPFESLEEALTTICDRMRMKIVHAPAPEGFRYRYDDSIETHPGGMVRALVTARLEEIPPPEAPAAPVVPELPAEPAAEPEKPANNEA